MPAPFVYQAPASCPPEADFRERVAGWLDATATTASGRLMPASGRLHVEAHPDERGDRAYGGEASLPRSGAVRDLHAATCDELVTAFAFVFAVDLDERVLQRAKPEPPPPPRAAPAASPAPSEPDRPRQLTLSAAVLSGIGGGVLPHANPLEGLEIAAQAGREGETGLVVSPRLRLGLGFDTPASASAIAASETLSASFYGLRARVDACPVAFVQPIVDVSVCARVETTLVFASGSSFAGARSATDVLFGIGASARVAFRLSSRWWLGVDGALVPTFGRDRFTVLGGQSSVYATSLLTESAQAVLAFRFR